MLRLAGAWLILNRPGGPTSGKPGVIAAVPGARTVFSSALNLRVADIRSPWRELTDVGAEFITSPMYRGPEIRCF